MRRLSLILLALLVVSVTSISAQQDDSAATPPVSDLTFRLLASDPAEGESLAPEQPVTLYFDRLVDCESARTAITIEPALPLDVTCDDAEFSVMLAPDGAFDVDTAYTLSIDAGLRALDGSALAEPLALQFAPGGALQVTEFLPADGSTDVATDALITVIFNRPVVPLGIVEDAEGLPDPLTIEPEAEGAGEWLNTSIYVFRAEPALRAGTEYTVTVNAGLEAVDGAVLEEDVTWSFTTRAPEIVTILPEDFAEAVELDAEISVTFTEPMDRESTEAAFSLRASPAENGAVVSGEFEWSEDGTSFVFTPDDLLDLDTLYLVTFEPDAAMPAAGGAPLPGASYSFLTVPEPAIISTNPPDGAEDVYPYTSFTIYFASPMNVATLEGKVVIEPEPWREADTYYSEYDNSYTLSFPVEPSTEYTVTIEPGMEDVYGNEITTETVVTFTTQPYEPDVMLQAPDPVGFYDALNEETRLFLTHRNVSEVNLALYEVPLETFGRALTSDEYYYMPAQYFEPSSEHLLRQWTIPSDTPQNQRRYELLSLGEGGGPTPVVCEGAPESRLSVGDIAVVISPDEPVRARSLPSTAGEIVTLMYRDYRLPVVGGPECSDGMVWWEVELRDNTTAWVAEGDDEEYFLDVRVAAASTPVVVEAGDDDGSRALEPGIYFLRASSPETEARQYQPVEHFLVVGTANLTMKVSADNVLVWATNVHTGEPIANAMVRVYGRDFELLGSGTTDRDGIVRINTPYTSDLYARRLAILETETHFGVGSSLWSWGIEPYEFGHDSVGWLEPYRVYLYTDRPVYRPDQPVYFRGVVRAVDDVTYTRPDFDTIPVTIYDENGEVVYERELSLTPYGTFSDRFDIAPDAPLGYYRIVAETPGQQDIFYMGLSQVGFSVAEYRLPEFQVTATAEADEVVAGDTIRVLVDSRYFFGGAVSGATVEYRIAGEPYFFDYQGPGTYSFIDFNADGGPGEFYAFGGEPVASGVATTDAQGQALIEVPADLKDATQSQRFTIEATVTDESGQAVSGRTEVIVHKGLVYVGVSPREYVSVAGQETTVDLIAVDWESEPVSGQTLEIEVVERRWSSVQEEDEYGRTTWTWEVEEIPVTTGSATTDSSGRATFSFTPPNGGIFKVLARTRDAQGNEVTASQTLWVSSEEYVSWRQQNSNRIELVADADFYSVGDTAEILIASPFQGQTHALITVERGDVLLADHIVMDNNSFVYELPITPDFAPNVYVSVVLVKGVDENNPVAAFRMGLVQLSVDTERKEITVEIEPSVEQAGPGDTVSFTVRTTDFEGDPVQAEVGVALTDLASLSLAAPNSPPLLAYFYGQQGLAVRTSMPLTINTDQITQTTLDTIKGGGGGLGEGGIFDIREEFIDTAYWNATLTTDAQGEATFEVTLPDNLTTWRLDARAVTSGQNATTLVGQATYDLLSTKPLLIRPVTPRFFVVGDQVTLAAIVNNNTGDEQEVQVALEGSGVTFEGDRVQTVTIEAGARARIEWPVVIQDVEAIDLTFYASGNDGEFTDASKPPLGQGDARLLPVLRFEAPETVGTSGLLDEGGSVTEAIALPQRLDVTQGELSVLLEPSLAATTFSGLEYLRNYPYMCTEQIVSRFLPNIMTYRALAAFDLDDPELEAGLTANVERALQQLYAQQHVDGGWGWFVQDASNPLVTAYALIGLHEAAEQGFTVSQRVIERAQAYLSGEMIAPSQREPEWRLNRQAFMLYALARTGAPDVARTATLYESRARLDHYARAFLALALHAIDPDDSRIDTLVSDLISAASLSATGAHWEEDTRDVWNWNTDTRTTAIVLEALVTLRPESDLIPNAVRYLMAARKADVWETTQETAWAVMALTDWMMLTGELNPNYDFSATLNGETLAEATATLENVTEPTRLAVDLRELLRDEANRLVISRTDGDGILYYTAHLRAFLPVPEIEPLNRGIIVERRYTLADGSSAESITQARVGDVIQVRLTVIAPNDLHYVVIEDPIPAGTDAINPELATSQQIGTQPELNPQDPLSQGWGWWWFSNIEYRDEKVVLFSTYLPAGTYEYVYSIRAGLPGTYNVIPTTGYEFYFPEVYGRGAGMTFTIEP
ncbi:MAG: Ig-like domain-containing protein [Chloroflexota bacterium]